VFLAAGFELTMAKPAQNAHLWVHPAKVDRPTSEFSKHFGNAPGSAASLPRTEDSNQARNAMTSTMGIHGPMPVNWHLHLPVPSSSSGGPRRQPGASQPFAANRSYGLVQLQQDSLLASSSSARSTDSAESDNEHLPCDSLSLFRTNNSKYGRHTLPSWVNVRKQNNPQSKEVQYMCHMVRSGLPFESSIRFNTHGGAARGH
ncbi:unnamed protein product, partial [Polarella glacialis]